MQQIMANCEKIENFLERVVSNACEDCMHYMELRGRQCGMCTRNAREQIERRGRLRCVCRFGPICTGFMPSFDADENTLAEQQARSAKAPGPY